jgi:hypothetical protein
MAKTNNEWVVFRIVATVQIKLARNLGFGNPRSIGDVMG